MVWRVVGLSRKWGSGAEVGMKACMVEEWELRCCNL
jgi:hypothetical protein